MPKSKHKPIIINGQEVYEVIPYIRPIVTRNTKVEVACLAVEFINTSDQEVKINRHLTLKAGGGREGFGSGSISTMLVWEADIRFAAPPTSGGVEIKMMLLKHPDFADYIGR